MNSKERIEAKAQEILEKGQALQQTMEQKQEEILRLQKEIEEIAQTLLVYEGAYTAYKQSLSLIEDEDAKETPENTDTE